jgi:hypothetical protein
MDDIEDHGSLRGLEKVKFDELNADLRSCQTCGTSTLCKINLHRKHGNVTFNMLRTWALMMVCPTRDRDCSLLCNLQASGAKGVTIKNPPELPMFAQFHANMTGDERAESRRGPSAGTSRFDLRHNSRYDQHHDGYHHQHYESHYDPRYDPRYDPHTPHYERRPPHYNTAQDSPTPRRPALREPSLVGDDLMPSSDLPDVEDNPYPLISDFIQQLALANPGKRFEPLLEYCEREEFSHINELKDVAPQDLVQKAQVSEGAAELTCKRIASVMQKMRDAKGKGFA